MFALHVRDVCCNHGGTDHVTDAKHSHLWGGNSLRQRCVGVQEGVSSLWVWRQHVVGLRVSLLLLVSVAN